MESENVSCCNKNHCNVSNEAGSSDGNGCNNYGTSDNDIHSSSASSMGATDASRKGSNPSTSWSAREHSLEGK